MISLIEVLDADRDLLTASDQLAHAQADAARAAVHAFRATGGGWRAHDDVTGPEAASALRAQHAVGRL